MRKQGDCKSATKLHRKTYFFAASCPQVSVQPVQGPAHSTPNTGEREFPFPLGLGSLQLDVN